MNRIICISREYGSGGHDVARKAADKLHIPCLDKQLMDRAVMESGLSHEMLREAEERLTSHTLFTTRYAGKLREFQGMAPGDIVFELEKRYIIAQADKGDCIIVGRCAEEILRGSRHLVVSIFITAPQENRVATICQRYPQLTQRAAELQIQREDKIRRAYYEYHTGRDWGVASNYDVCLNAGSMGTDRIAELIAESFCKIQSRSNKGEV